MLDHCGANQIQFDVALTGEQIVVLLREASTKPSLPKRPAALIGAIDVLEHNVAPSVS